MQPVKRQVEAALAEIEGSSKNGGYEAMRRYLQLVCKSLAAPRCSLVLAMITMCMISSSLTRRSASSRLESQKL